MERSEKPWEKEGENREENEIHEEEEGEVNGGLEVKGRRQKRAGFVIGGSGGGSFQEEERDEEQSSASSESEKGEEESNASSDSEIVEEESKVEEGWSVYLDSEKVTDSNSLSGTNGTTAAQMLAAPQEISTPENGSSSKSESHSYLFSNREKGSTSNSVVNIKELDLEKILEEQETHDLYCPNCNSCITRRVILKKRKRIARDVKSDLPPEKIPHTETPKVDEREPTSVLFKCLSCFSFFIPTDCCSDIFHLFGKKESIQIPSTTPNKDQIQITVDPQTTEEINNTISAHPKEDILGIATSETKGKVQITVNQEASCQPSQGDNYNWFLGFLQPRGNQKKITKQEKVDQEPSKIVKERQENKVPDENQVVEEQKTDIIAPDKVSTPPSASEITEIKETTTTDVKMPDSSHLFNKQKDPNAINVSSEIQDAKGPAESAPTASPHTIINMPTFRGRECCCPGININNWDILKPIVYGGLVESITSLSIVTSASSTGATTLNILLLALANLIGGFILIIHDLSELKHAQDEADDRNEDELGRYWALLGRKGHFWLHASFAIISYIFFGLIPPLVYAFTFRETDKSEYKLIAVAAASLVCIAILSIGKAHVRPNRTYFTTMLYYITIGASASGLSYVAGMLLKQLIDSLGLFSQGSSLTLSPPSMVGGTNLGISWASF